MLWARGVHLLQPHPAVLRFGARHVLRPAQWLAQQLGAHPEVAMLLLDALMRSPSTGEMAQRLGTAGGAIAGAAEALARQLQERDDPQAAARIAQALAELDAARLGGELLAEALYGLIKDLPTHQIAGLQLFLGIGAVVAHWGLSQRHRAVPAPVLSPADAPLAERMRVLQQRSMGLDRVAWANAVEALSHAGQGVLGEGYAPGVALSLSEGVRGALGQWLARSRSQR